MARTLRYASCLGYRTVKFRLLPKRTVFPCMGAAHPLHQSPRIRHDSLMDISIPRRVYQVLLTTVNLVSNVDGLWYASLSSGHLSGRSGGCSIRTITGWVAMNRARSCRSYSLMSAVTVHAATSSRHGHCCIASCQHRIGCQSVPASGDAAMAATNVLQRTFCAATQPQPD